MMHWWRVSVRRGPVAVVFRVRAVSSEGAVALLARWSHADAYSIVSIHDEGLVTA